ncbi:Aldehyde/histidinol dehydrogenase [Phlyctochytrium arcticum]|nr:Aldehyde/histidinol dehydrogenase [Phlyctochytrium arcticum]
MSQTTTAHPDPTKDSDSYTIISPIDYSSPKAVQTVSLLSPSNASAALDRAHQAHLSWKSRSLDERITVIRKLVEEVVKDADDIARELVDSLARPVQHSKHELNGFKARADYLLSVAPDALADTPVEPPVPGFRKFMRKEPVGVCLVIAAWNYPYLIAVNSVVPALVAGNAVLLKHAPQTFLIAERLAKAAKLGGVPDGLFQAVPMSHATTSHILQNPLVSLVTFTGSVAGGRAIAAQTASRFIPLNLELGGKDPAYVREDADLDHAAENIVEGVCYNAGQSCCAVERIYVHEKVYDGFVAKATKFLQDWKLGKPTDAATTVGPVVSLASGKRIAAHISAALALGAKGFLPNGGDPPSGLPENYISPNIFVNVPPSADLATQETFGPVAVLYKVSSDEEAIRLMNDSEFGLSASIWTRDVGAGLKVCEKVEAGTVFVNRCDFLDPGLAWTGWKDSGRGVSLSKFGYDYLTKLKSFHLRDPPKTS